MCEDFGAIEELSEDGAGALASGAVGVDGAGAAGVGEGAGEVCARTGEAANSAVATKAALNRGSFIGSPNDKLLRWNGRSPHTARCRMS